MNDIDILKVRTWLDNVQGPRADSYAERWHDFASTANPVITVFGSYDTGKSSLIRRLLVDSGVQVPEWLTISARHETFGVNGVELAGCLLRDTPGLAIGADDARGALNTELAREAISTTDIAIVTLTPQLATGEFDLLREVVAGGWSAANLWFVISRFDEAGIDPDDDLDGYQRLASRKRAELGSSLKLSSEFPMHVVSQDFAQMAGAARDVDSDVWDDSRDWDGMDGLATAIKTVASGDIVALRASTEQRYWRQALMRTLADLKIQRAESGPLIEQADAASARREQWASSLHDVDRDAKADLRGVVGKAVRQVFAAGEQDSAVVAEDLQSALNDWYRKHTRELDRLLQDVARTDERQRKEPSWANLEALASEVAAAAEPAVDGHPDALAPYVSKFGPLLIGGLRDFERSQRGASSKKAAGRAAAIVKTGGDVGSLAKGVALASALLPLAVEIVNSIDGARSNKALAVQEQANRAREEKFTTEANELALASWAAVLAGAKAEIDAAAVHAELSDALRDSAKKLAAAIEEAENLL